MKKIYIYPLIFVVTFLIFAGCKCRNLTVSSSSSDVIDLNAVSSMETVTLSWTDPEDEDLDKIEITWTPEEGVAQPVTVPAGEKMVVITELSFGTPYDFTVRTVDTRDDKSPGKSIRSITKIIAHVTNIATSFTASGHIIRNLDIARIGAHTYLFAAIPEDRATLSSLHPSGFAVFRVNGAGMLENVTNVAEEGPISPIKTSPIIVTTAKIGMTTYLFGSKIPFGRTKRSLSSFSVDSRGELVHIIDANASSDFIQSLTTAEVEGTTYLFTGFTEVDEEETRGGVDVFRVDSSGELSKTYNIDGVDLLSGKTPLIDVDPLITAKIGRNIYLFTVSSATRLVARDSITWFRVNDDGTLIFVNHINNDITSAFPYTSIRALTTAKIGSATYLFAGGLGNTKQGVSFSRVDDDGKFKFAIDNIIETLGSIHGIFTAVVDNRTWLFIMTSTGISVYQLVDTPLTFTLIQEVEASDFFSLVTAEVEGTTYLFIGRWEGRGLSVFQVGLPSP